MARSWRTVRVFISSTFRDMHAERDHLVKVVFPELRERMAGRHLHLVDIDLRWGITEEEAEQGKALEICLEEIERSRPFFIGMLGERYGSLLGSLPEDAELDHPWLAGARRALADGARDHPCRASKPRAGTARLLLLPRSALHRPDDGARARRLRGRGRARRRASSKR